MQESIEAVLEAQKERKKRTKIARARPSTPFRARKRQKESMKMIDAEYRQTRLRTTHH
jgi:hypothetical protein